MTSGCQRQLPSFFCSSLLLFLCFLRHLLADSALPPCPAASNTCNATSFETAVAFDNTEHVVYNNPCVFPFYHGKENKLFWRCIQHGPNSWCFYKVWPNLTGVPNKRGHCQPNVPECFREFRGCALPASSTSLSTSSSSATTAPASKEHTRQDQQATTSSEVPSTAAGQDNGDNVVRKPTTAVRTGRAKGGGRDPSKQPSRGGTTQGGGKRRKSKGGQRRDTDFDDEFDTDTDNELDEMWWDNSQLGLDDTEFEDTDNFTDVDDEETQGTTREKAGAPIVVRSFFADTAWLVLGAPGAVVVACVWCGLRRKKLKKSICCWAGCATILNNCLCCCNESGSNALPRRKGKKKVGKRRTRNGKEDSEDEMMELVGPAQVAREYMDLEAKPRVDPIAYQALWKAGAKTEQKRTLPVHPGLNKQKLMKPLEAARLMSLAVGEEQGVLKMYLYAREKTRDDLLYQLELVVHIASGSGKVSVRCVGGEARDVSTMLQLVEECLKAGGLLITGHEEEEEEEKEPDPGWADEVVARLQTSTKAGLLGSGGPGDALSPSATQTRINLLPPQMMQTVLLKTG
eukprot:g37023.t1